MIYAYTHVYAYLSLYIYIYIYICNHCRLPRSFKRDNVEDELPDAVPFGPPTAANVSFVFGYECRKICTMATMGIASSALGVQRGSSVPWLRWASSALEDAVTSERRRKQGSGVNRGQIEHKGSFRDVRKKASRQHPHRRSGQSHPLNYPP